MDGSVLIRGLVVDSHCGVTPEERASIQELNVDATITYDMSQAVRGDEITDAVDYEQVCELLKDVACTKTSALLETLGSHMISHLFEMTEAQTIALTLTKKTRSAILGDQGSIGTTISAQRREGQKGNRPSSLLTTHLALIPRGRALDIATGRGRNALFLAQAGFDVDGIDRDSEALAACEKHATHLGLKNLSLKKIDLEQAPLIEENAYDLIVNTYYLQRDLAPAMAKALKVGGILVFETFLIENHHRFNHPRRTEFCLKPNELLNIFRDLTVLFYQEGVVDDSPYLARLVATK